MGIKLLFAVAALVLGFSGRVDSVDLKDFSSLSGIGRFWLSSDKRLNIMEPMRGLEEQGWFHVYLIDATGRPVLGKMYMVKIYDETEASDLREYLGSHLDQNASWRLDGVKGWLQRGTRQVSGVQLMRLAFSEPLKSEIISKVQDFYAE